MTSHEALSEEHTFLQTANGVLYNNAFGKGDIQNYKQKIYADSGKPGWAWEWPEDRGNAIKAYPEIITGRSPWSRAEHGHLLPCILSEVICLLDFDFSTKADGLWCGSLDFWITDTAHPSPSDIICNLCIWEISQGLEGNYKGKKEKIHIDGRNYEATIETPSDQPAKTWNTLFLTDTQARTKGTINLSPYIAVILDLGLAKPGDLLATAEMGTEIASGKGKTVVNEFKLHVIPSQSHKAMYI